MKNKILVELCDKEYTLVTEERDDYVRAIVREVNEMIVDISYKSFKTSKADAAILACLDLCDRNKKLSEANDNLREQLAMYLDEINALNRQLSKEKRSASAGEQKSLID